MTKSRLLLSSLALIALAAALLWAPAQASVRAFGTPFVEMWRAVTAGKEAVVGLWLLARDRAQKETSETREREAVALEREAYARLREDLEALQALFGRTRDAHPILAGVLAAPPSARYDTLIVDAGSRDGVQAGMVALAHDTGWPVGIVDVVEERLSRVRLFSSPGTHIRALVGQTATPIALTGKGGGVLEGALPRSLAPEVGEVVWGSDVGQLPVGKVVRVSGSPARPEVMVVVRLTPNPFTLTRVVLSREARMLPKKSWESLLATPEELPIGEPASATTENEGAALPESDESANN